MLGAGSLPQRSPVPLRASPARPFVRPGWRTLALLKPRPILPVGLAWFSGKQPGRVLKPFISSAKRARFRKSGVSRKETSFSRAEALRETRLLRKEAPGAPFRAVRVLCSPTRVASLPPFLACPGLAPPRIVLLRPAAARRARLVPNAAPGPARARRPGRCASSAGPPALPCPWVCGCRAVNRPWSLVGPARFLGGRPAAAGFRLPGRRCAPGRRAAKPRFLAWLGSAALLPGALLAVSRPWRPLWAVFGPVSLSLVAPCPPNAPRGQKRGRPRRPPFPFRCSPV